MKPWRSRLTPDVAPNLDTKVTAVPRRPQMCSPSRGRGQRTWENAGAPPRSSPAGSAGILPETLPLTKQTPAGLGAEKARPPPRAPRSTVAPHCPPPPESTG